MTPDIAHNIKFHDHAGNGLPLVKQDFDNLWLTQNSKDIHDGVIAPQSLIYDDKQTNETILAEGVGLILLFICAIMCCQRKA